MSHWKKLWSSEEGQDLTEYSLLLAFVALTTAGLVTGPMSSINTIWIAGSHTLSTAATSVS